MVRPAGSGAGARDLLPEAGGASSRVSFVCQRCLQPLTIDQSFGSMNEHVNAELTLPISPVPPAPVESHLTSKAPEMDRYVPPFKLGTPAAGGGNGGAAPDTGFTLVDGETGDRVNAGVIRSGQALNRLCMLFCKGIMFTNGIAAVFWRNVILVIYVIFELGPDSESLFLQNTADWGSSLQQ